LQPHGNENIGDYEIDHKEWKQDKKSDLEGALKLTCDERGNDYPKLLVGANTIRLLGVGWIAFLRRGLQRRARRGPSPGFPFIEPMTQRYKERPVGGMGVREQEAA
jgi:hypothetical protein